MNVILGHPSAHSCVSSAIFLSIEPLVIPQKQVKVVLFLPLVHFENWRSFSLPKIALCHCVLEYI